jgi:hypothetical protein
MRNARVLVLAGLLVLAAIYVGDDLSLRFHVPASRQAFGTVTVERYDAIPEKNGKVEFGFEPPVEETCVHSPFPHMGYPPCWYLSRHAEQRINY